MPHLLLLLLLAQDQPAFRTGVTLVRVDAEVRQGRQSITGLAKENFRVSDGGKPRTIVYFGHQEEPLDVVLLFDTRNEMRTAVKRVAEAAHKALSDLREGDRIAIMAFGGAAGSCDTDLISDFTGNFDSAERAIEAQVLQREFRPGTNLCQIQKGFDGAAERFLRYPAGNRRRAIIAVTDDHGAPTRPDAARNAIRDLWKSDSVVLGVIVKSSASGYSIGPPYRGARYAAEKTGGDTLDTVDAAEGLHQMIHRLRSRYSLYYALPRGKPGEERKIRVRLSPDVTKRYPQAAVAARTGYVMPE